jgi:hypothetical protein
MRRDGRQFVCSTCKGWNDSGLMLAATVGVR